MADKPEMLRDLESGTRETLGLLQGLSPAEWNTPSQVEGWRVSDVAAHLLEVDEKIVVALRPQRTVSAFADDSEPLSRADRIRRYESAGEEIRDLAVALAEADMDSRVEVLHLGQMPARVALYLRLFEQFNHTNDILFALRRPLRYLPELVAPALRFVRLAAPWLISRERIADVNLRYGFRFDDEKLGQWRLVLSRGHARVEAWRGQATDVVVSGDAACFLLEFALGKGGLKQALLSRRLRIRGDHEACAKLRYCFPLLVPSLG